MNDVVDFLKERDRFTFGNVTTSLDDDPEEVGRAIELGKGTGVDPTLVYGDLENFDKELRSNLVYDTVRRDRWLQDYSNSNPLAAKVSNDDWAELSDLSKRITKMSPYVPGREAGLSILLKMSQAFSHGLDLDRPLGKDIVKDRPEDLEFQKTHPLIYQELKGIVGAGAEIYDLIARPIKGASQALGIGVAEALLQAGASESTAKGWGREAMGIMEYQLQQTPKSRVGWQTPATVGVPKFGEAVGQFFGPRITPEFMKEMGQAYKVAEPYFKVGLEPPTGLHPLWDRFKEAQAKLDKTNLDEAVTAADATKTKQRAPDLLEEGIKLKNGGTLSIDGETAAKLYGDKVPSPSDGLLGWVPNIEEQLKLARDTGQDIEVPIAGWLARVDKEVHKTLRDDIRSREGGLTINEAKALSEWRQEYLKAVEEEKAALKEEVKPEVLEPQEAPTEDWMLTQNRLRVRELMDRLEQAKTFEEVNQVRREIAAPPAERLAKAAVRVEGKIYEGAIHIDAVQAAARQLGKPIEEIIGLVEADTQGAGFTTSTGRYVSRDEAFEIGRGQAQIREGIAREEFLAEQVQFEPKVRTWLDEVYDAQRSQAALEGVRTQGALRHPQGWERIGPAEEQRPPAAFSLKTINTFDVQDTERIRHSVTSIGTTTAREAFLEQGLNALVTGPAAKYFRQMGTFLSGKIGDVPIHIVTDEVFAGLSKKRPTSGGFYDPMHHTIVIREGAYRHPNLPYLLLHEAVHAASSREMNVSKGKVENINKLMADLVKVDPTLWNEYGFKSAQEFVAETFSNHLFREKLAKLKISESLGKELGLRRPFGNFLEMFTKMIWDMLGRPKEIPLSALDAAINVSFEPIKATLSEAQKIEYRRLAGEMPRAEPQLAPEVPTTKMKQGELEVTRQGDKPIFDKPKTIGLTKERQQLYDRLMAQQRQEDAAWQLSWFEKNERRSQTKEWKENYKKVEQEVYIDLQARPDFAALDYLINGKLYGQKTGRITLEAASLTEEQIAKLPKGTVAKLGAKPDDVAAMFGYPDGASMIDHLSQLREKGLSTKDYLDRVMKEETDRVMKERYGDLEANILKSAQEHVLFSDAQWDMLHEQTVAYGMKAGSEITFTAADVSKWVRTELNNSRVSQISVDKFLNASGKSGRNAELALLKQDYVTAYKEKQAQYFAYALAKEAKKFEKEQVKFDTLASKYRYRQLPAVDQEFTNFIHLLMDKADMPEQRRTLQDINDSIAADRNTSLEMFSQKVDNTTPYELHITPEILQYQFGKLKDMTVAEWREFRDALTSLDHVGRKMRTIDLMNKESTYAEWKKEAKTNLETREIIPEEKQVKGLFSRIRWDAELVRMEEVFKDLDLRRGLGPFFKAIIMPLIEAKHDKYKLEEELSKRLSEMKGHDKKWQKTLKDTIPNDFFVNPLDGVPFDMTREWMIHIMLNWGNASNREKFVRGWSKSKEDAAKLDAQLDAMINKHANKDDWDFVQQVGDIFEGWRQKASVMYRNISGIAPKWIEINPIDTPHGQYRGWYFPLIHSKYHSGINVIKEQQTVGQLFGSNYYRATTANRYIRERTGSFQPIEFRNSIDLVASRMQQTMHDIAYRVQIGQVAKILYDKEIRALIRQRYGAVYEAQLIPWLQDIANYHNFDESKLAFHNDWLRRGRMNLMVHALGLNLKVILSPDVGTFNIKDLAHLAWNSDKDVTLAWEKSQEIPHTYRNIDRDFRERLETNARKFKADSFQSEAAKWGFLPLVKASQAFRIATFVGEYKRGKMKGLGEAEAVAAADSLVRLRHGATGIVDLPAVMRGSEGMKTMTMFYGFFNAMYNWQREIPGNLKRGEWTQAIANAWGSWAIPSAFGAALFNKAKEDEPLWKTWLKAFGLQGASMLPFARDLAGMMIEGHRPSSPLASLWQAGQSVVTDVKNVYQGKKVKKPVQHAINLIGLATPLPAAQIGRTAQFAHDVYRGEQRMNRNASSYKNIMEWVRGTIHGESKLKK